MVPIAVRSSAITWSSTGPSCVPRSSVRWTGSLHTAPPIDQDFFGPIEIDNQSIENIRAAWYPYTMPFNLTGNPAISLPCGFDAAGMPLAIQLIARPGEDERLLRVAALFERARPWAGRTPTI
jgi:aspartyl-tRNA(Asn)/glutamyl-tRNA(Gln) amidotransferase subunit A